MNNTLKLLAIVESDNKPFYGLILQMSDGSFVANDLLAMQLEEDFSFPFKDEAAIKELNYNLSQFIRGIIEQAQKKAVEGAKDE